MLRCGLAKFWGALQRPKTRGAVFAGGCRGFLPAESVSDACRAEAASVMEGGGDALEAARERVELQPSRQLPHVCSRQQKATSHGAAVASEE